MKILCIGEALIDMICTDRGFSLSKGDHFLKKTGGAPTNVAAAVAALGGEVDLMAKVGNDAFGDQLLSEMALFGVSTQFMCRDAEKFTTIAFVSLMENGERDFIFNRGADGTLCLADIKDFDIASYNIVHFGSATAFLDGALRETYYHMLDVALKANVFVSFDPNYSHLLFKNNIQSFIDHCWIFLDRCDFFKVSDEEAMLLTKSNSLEEAIVNLQRRTQAHFAITLGKDGTVFRYQNEIHTVESIVVTPVDTTGAGDAFVGAVLCQLSISNRDNLKHTTLDQWIKVILNGNKAGARTCEYLGAMEAFKQLNSTIFNEK
ncbi:MAG: carbohydrate kinase [Saprospiraceae bacterium]|nr:carbohydrate kinase [Saprospiraceae bacterium]